MKTVLSIRPTTQLPAWVEIPILNAPPLMAGDTFHLSLFARHDDLATVTKRHWNGPDCYILCTVSEFTLRDLVKLGKRHSSCIDLYELPETEWK